MKMQFIEARIYSSTLSAWVFAVLISLTLHARLESLRLSAFGLTCKVVQRTGVKVLSLKSGLKDREHQNITECRVADLCGGSACWAGRNPPSVN
ncbi:hypothetical protein ACE1ET_00340 [Saccharicrinis sp. FJH62]|uniref:hypothetical protein n=1 Tax=Saccharicrinis sp. FJH62 TaxID=3344657 RepID=UPI0035D44111